MYDGSNNLLMRFEYADGRMPVSMTRSGSTYYLSYDQVGTLRSVYDSTGAIVKRVDYDSFGNIITDTAPAFAMPFGFAGGLHDRDTGLVHFGYRDYDPATGRWTAKDPIGFAGGDVNVYGYCLEDPVNWVDPDGLKVYIVDDPNYYYEQATAYLMKDSVAAKIIKDLEGSSKNYFILINHNHNDFTDESNGVIGWDPLSASKNVDKDKNCWSQSPALGLLHEMAHLTAPWYIKGFRKLWVPYYGNLGEWYAISRVESHAARTLKESVRRTHKGKTYRSTSPTSR